jgi:hypothetical protein
MAGGEGGEGFLPPLADQQGQGGSGQSPGPETTRNGGRIREGDLVPLTDQAPTLLGHAGHEQATPIREAGGGLVFGELPSFAEPSRTGAVRLPLIKDRDPREGVGQGAPPPRFKVPVSGIKADQSIRKEARLRLGMAVCGGAFGLNLPACMAHQLRSLRLPMASGARAEAGDVEGGHIRRDA